jgi:Protein of unknown function (DUF2459)
VIVITRVALHLCAVATAIARRSVALALLLALSGCAAAVRPDAPPPTTGNTKPIFVLNHGWHSGLAIHESDIPPGLLPEANDFSNAENLEVGWGDWDYYQAPNAGVGLATRAALFSRASTLHVVGFRGAAKDYFPEAQIFELSVSEDGFRRLIQFISDTFIRESDENPRPGFYPDSRFYPAREVLHLQELQHVGGRDA